MMGKRQVGELFKSVLNSAANEARLRGDRRIGTDHLLLAILNQPDSTVAEDLGVNRDQILAAEATLDADALVELGIGIYGLWLPEVELSNKRLPPLTAASREVIKEAFNRAKPRSTGRLTHRDFLEVLLSRVRPDPAAELLAAVGVDSDAVRSQISNSRQKKKP